MKPTLEKLNDPQWWSDNVKDEYNYAFTTGPKWDGLDDLVGTFEFASEDGYMGGDESLYVDETGWILLCKRPTKAFVPEVGVECEFMDSGKWSKCKIDYICEQYIVVFMPEYGNYEALVKDFNHQFRPIKSKRELFVEAVEGVNKAHQWTTKELAEALYDAGFKAPEVIKG